MSATWTIDDMRTLARRHALAEAEGKLDEVMATMAPHPVYEFYPLGLRFTGLDNTRRYYSHFCRNLFPHIQSSRMISEWADAYSVAQEYNVTIGVDGNSESFRVLGVLFADGGLIGGERIYGSERLIRLLIGDLLDELEPVTLQ